MVADSLAAQAKHDNSLSTHPWNRPETDRSGAAPLGGDANRSLRAAITPFSRDAAACPRALADALSTLSRAGHLELAELSTVDRLLLLLLTVAHTNLPLARLVEGHANALLLIDALGTAAQKADLASPGKILGVWGAGGADPLRTDGERLARGKRFASGLGMVSRAVVTVAAKDGVRLAIVDVSDPVRHSPCEKVDAY